MRVRLLSLAVATAAALSTLPAQADENMLGYAYGAETLPAGGNELYLWLTDRRGKGEGDYAAQDYAVEFEHGWTDHFQTSFYITGRGHDYCCGAVEEHEEEDEAGGIEEGDEALDRTLAWDGFKVAFKWNVKSPYKDGYGLAFYVEPEYSRISKVSGEHERAWGLETKLLLQKNFLDDQLVAIYNLTLEPEWEREAEDGEVEWERELEIEHSGGLSYRFAPNWFVGVETVLRATYPEHGGRENWAWSAGPSLHYGGQRWWATLTWMPQIKGGPTDEDRSDRLSLEDYERRETRLKLGFNF